MAKTIRAIRRLSVAQSAQGALLGGACLLVIGIALVGVGATALGVLPVMLGLASTILAIHRYGRLGPDDPGAERDLDERRVSVAVAKGWILRGWLTLGVSVLVIAGSYGATDGTGFIVMSAAFLWGGAQLVRGQNMLSRAKRAKAKVEKRRRMDKSPPP